MPKGVTKDKFKEFSQYYEEDIFIEAGRKIRNTAKYADTLSPTDRVLEIANIFSSFRNPDKETVLTPWKTVNQHLGDCIGGFNFFDKVENNGIFTLVTLEDPKYISKGDVTTSVYTGDNPKILEINSKSGLYPLYITYSIYRHKCLNVDSKKLTDEMEEAIWNEILDDNIFVLCKTPMAKSITERTLRGYKDVNTNVIYDKELENNIENNLVEYAKEVNKSKYWKKEGDIMNFNAIVGNPPYQRGDGSGASDDSAVPVYNQFVDFAKQINPEYISMIMPSKWMVGGRGLNSFRSEMIQDHRLEKMFDFEDARVCFSNVHIDGGICYLLWNRNYDGPVYHEFTKNNGTVVKVEHYLGNEFSDYVIRDTSVLSLMSKLNLENSFSQFVSSTQPFGVRKDVYNNPEKYKEYNVSEEYKDGKVKVYGVKGIKGGAKRTTAYFDKAIVQRGEEFVDKYKLFFTTSYSTNAIIPPQAIIGAPGEICTETFLMIGPFDDCKECENCKKYMETDFFRTLLYFGKGTMQVTKSVFSYIPMMDFSKEWTDEKIIEHFMLDKNDIDLIKDTMKKDNSDDE